MDEEEDGDAWEPTPEEAEDLRRRMAPPRSFWWAVVVYEAAPGGWPEEGLLGAFPHKADADEVARRLGDLGAECGVRAHHP